VHAGGILRKDVNVCGVVGCGTSPHPKVAQGLLIFLDLQVDNGGPSAGFAGENRGDLTCQPSPNEYRNSTWSPRPIINLGSADITMIIVALYIYVPPSQTTDRVD
jgi:hypothetical protein